MITRAVVTNEKVAYSVNDEDSAVGFEPPCDRPKARTKPNGCCQLQGRERGGRGKCFLSSIPSDPDRNERVPGEASERDRKRKHFIGRLYDDPLCHPAKGRSCEEERPNIFDPEMCKDNEKNIREQGISQPCADPIFERIFGTDARPEKVLGKSKRKYNLWREPAECF